MNNPEVAKAFLAQRRGSNSSGSYSSDGVKLWSYNTVIAQWINGQIVGNKTKYSCTSSRHLGYIKKHISSYTYKNVPIDSNDLTYYLPWQQLI